MQTLTRPQRWKKKVKNPTRQTRLEDLDAARTARVRQDGLSPDARFEEKLRDLRIFVRQLAETESGRAELQLRARLFGEFRPEIGESPRDHYGRLRSWLDRELVVDV